MVLFHGPLQEFPCRADFPPAVVDEADYSGSTAQMLSFVQTHRPQRVAAG